VQNGSSHAGCSGATSPPAQGQPLSAPASPALGTDAYHGRSLLKGRPTPQGDNRVPVLAITLSKVCQIFRAAHCSSSGREYRFGRSTASPDAGKIDGLCAERDRLKAELPRPKEGLGRKEVVKHFQDDPNQPPFNKLLEQGATNLLDLQTSQPLVRREDGSTSRQRAQCRFPAGSGLLSRKILARTATLRRKRRTTRHKEGCRRPVH